MERPNQHQGSLTLPKVSVSLFSITLVADQVEQVILYLERRAQKEPEAQKRFEVGGSTAADQSSGPNRKDGCEPAGFLQHHLQVLGVTDFGGVVVSPSKFHRLPFGTLARHSLGLFDYPEREFVPDGGAIVEQRAERHQCQRVARIERQRHSVEQMESWKSAPSLAAVLNIVMNEQCVV